MGSRIRKLIMKKLTLVTLLCFLLGGTHNAFSAPNTILMPPQLSKAFITAAYRGKKNVQLYRQMSQSYREKVSYTQFRRDMKSWVGSRYKSKLKLITLRQEPLSNREGIIYYLAQTRRSFFSKKNDYFSLEKVEMILEGHNWKLKKLPTQLIASEMNEKLNQKDYMMVYRLVEKDRTRELMSHALKGAVFKSLRAARSLAQDGYYRKALMGYQKVLHLKGNHEEALSGMAYCQNQLVQYEDSD